MIRHGLAKVAASAIDFLLEHVTGIVMNTDGTADAKGADERDVSTSIGGRFGFYSRTKDGAVGIVVRFAGLSFLGAVADKQFAMSLQKGEVGIQNAFSASVLLDKNGNIVQTPGGSGTVQLGGNSYSLPRLESLLSDINTLASNLVAWVPLVVTAVATAPSGAAVDPGVVAAANAIISAIAAGSYKSTKAKNG